MVKPVADFFDGSAQRIGYQIKVLKEDQRTIENIVTNSLIKEWKCLGYSQEQIDSAMKQLIPAMRAFENNSIPEAILGSVKGGIKGVKGLLDIPITLGKCVKLASDVVLDITKIHMGLNAAKNAGSAEAYGHHYAVAQEGIDGLTQKFATLNTTLKNLHHAISLTPLFFRESSVSEVCEFFTELTTEMSLVGKMIHGHANLFEKTVEVAEVLHHIEKKVDNKQDQAS